MPFAFSKTSGSKNLTKQSCVSTTFYVQVKCSGDGHWPGDSSCLCGDPDQDCDVAYTILINGQVCQASTLDDDPDPGNPWSGGGSGGDPTTNPNAPTQPGGGFDCIAGYDCAGDPYQDQQTYAQCKYTIDGDNCWTLCEYANCSEEDKRRFDLSQKLNVTERAISSISDAEVVAINNFIGNGVDSQKNNFAQEAIGVLTNSSSHNETELVIELINSLNTNVPIDLKVYLNGPATIMEQGPIVQCCDDYDPYNDPNRDMNLMFMLGYDLLTEAGDGLYSLFFTYLEYAFSDKVEGIVIRDLIEYKNYDIPTDIPDETLGELFQIRQNNRQIELRAEQGIGDDIVDIGLSLVDVFTLISPSKGGGAFLAINQGQRVTIATFKKYLDDIKQFAYKPTGGMLGKRIGHTFKKHGSHNTLDLLNLAKRSPIPQGQWLNDFEAENFIFRHLDQLNNGARDIPIPTSYRDVGRVFRNGDGFILEPTHIRLVPSGSGVLTAYPLNEALELSLGRTLNPLGTFIP